MASTISNTTASSTTATDASGNKYTTSVSNDSLTTNDFLKLMIEQLKLQDPTKPYDSAKMLETQMQMSTLNANMQMISTLESISTAFQQTSISNAAGLIGSSIENGSKNSSGSLKSYYVESIENVDGSLIVKGRELLYAKDKIQLNVDGEVKAVNYDDNGNIYNEKGEKTGETLVLDSIGQPSVGTDGKLKVKDANGKEVSSHNYELTGTYTLVYSTELTDIPYSSITRISA
ncbi:flagellar hook capping FlgD N-terminal domain-containing protein [Aliarcobacter butzleri]|uniref:flagellar hook capping FlgD N-terminal domain-containing protein n=1 Tax=Aliarcobacter butzleri TaxID=28197 RepID=UPI000DB52A8B|nr:flagellar hook capping FlgD N-terminal domain-containing protein [Aliarcobacter butzleri]MCG3652303.1 flagellar biosynthesis protein FlgD [Aliarcobacter butzleri]MCG3659180.1 flagellar biosynthesis protein FlgD [Aliarcobacter butzleri]MCG3670477.1 flagellar biosynthesis protein FlgD [Aliarcobacter butzleri]MCG3672618.1 flagellar biosynthesis protein FlgD [Aliarcobacter butzleri]MCG3681563.1 flagellar biosynthesis protein FlgD [Aliarcobacter butzleri]